MFAALFTNVPSVGRALSFSLDSRVDNWLVFIDFDTSCYYHTQRPVTDTDTVFFDIDGVVVDSEQYWVEYETERIVPAIEESTNGVRAASRSDMTVFVYGDPAADAISTVTK